MKNKKNQKGFLLMEALLSLSLLVVGVLAAGESFHFLREAGRRGEETKGLAEQLERQWLGLDTGVGPDGLSWSTESRTASPRIEVVTWKATWTKEDRSHEESFDTVQWIQSRL